MYMCLPCASMQYTSNFLTGVECKKLRANSKFARAINGARSKRKRERKFLSICRCSAMPPNSRGRAFLYRTCQPVTSRLQPSCLCRGHDARVCFFRRTRLTKPTSAAIRATRSSAIACNVCSSTWLACFWRVFTHVRTEAFTRCLHAHT